MDTAAEKEARRGVIEQEHSKARDDREKLYIQEREDLEADYRADLANIAEARVIDLTAAGLNTDGSDPQERPTG